MALGLFDAFKFFENSERENFVFWYELIKGNKGNFVKLCSAPLDVSTILYENLYKKLKSVMLTSATLTIENRFKYMIKKLGLKEIEKNRLETLMLGSPYEMEKQLKVIVPSYVATPKNEVVYENDLNELIQKLANNFDLGTLTLFTSYRSMNRIFDKVKNSFRSIGKMLLIQGKDGSRKDIVEQFKKQKNSFLFGTDSFWEGVDVPGKALEALIITKLPFQVPTEPVIQARIEKIEQEGNNSFMHYSVPEAILKFKQGVGRLIRSKSDSGVVYIVDSRASNTRWGQAFINSLSVKPSVCMSLKDTLNTTKIFENSPECN